MADDYQTMVARIARELRRTDLQTEIQDAIKSAISYFEMERWHFSESRSTTWNTVALQEFYTSADDADIPRVIEIDALTITISGNRYPLNSRDYDHIEHLAMTTTSTGQPQDYCYYAQQIRLYPIPDNAYTLRLSGIFPQTPLAESISLSTDTNAWFRIRDGEALIRARAEWDILTNRVNDPERAAILQAVEGEALAALRSKRDRQLRTGHVRPTWF